MDATTLFHRSAEFVSTRVKAVGPDQWSAGTPCEAWTVRELVNHIAYENAWAVPLLDGLSIADVGSKLDGDLLGEEDPVGAAVSAVQAALDAVDASLASGGTVDTSQGATPMDEYARQLAAENFIHGWDLAAAIGGDTGLDADLVEEVTVWYADREEPYRASGGVGPRRELTGEAWPDLLARFGRDVHWQASPAA